VHPGRRLFTAGGILLMATSLGACEYADAEPQPRTSTAAVQSAPAHSTMSAEEAARQEELMADVESLLDFPMDGAVLGLMGGMRDGGGISGSGLLSEAGTYPVRFVCTGGAGAMLTVQQDGTLLLSQRIDCGTPYDAVVDVASGQISASLEPVGRVDLMGGAVRFGAPQDPGNSGAAG
jgi:hypothetical protein